MSGAADADSLTGLRPDESIYVGQNELDRHRTELLAAEFAGQGRCTGRLDCMLARRRGPGSEEWLVHERWHDERFIHGEFTTSLAGPHDRLVAVDDQAIVIEVTRSSTDEARQEALALLERGASEVFSDGAFHLDIEANNVRLFVLLVGGRLAGVMPCQKRDRHLYSAIWAGPLCVTNVRAESASESWTVLYAWLRGGYRGKTNGRVSQFLDGVLSLLGVTLDELAWQAPFTAAGARFVRQLTGGGRVLVWLNRPPYLHERC